jgi:hypothetical protein
MKNPFIQHFPILIEIINKDNKKGTPGNLVS